MPSRKKKAEETPAATSDAPEAVEAPKHDEPPKCVACGKLLDWRDRAYGTGDVCKRCTRKVKDAALKGRFIPAREYVRQLQERNKPVVKPMVKAGAQ